MMRGLALLSLLCVGLAAQAQPVRRFALVMGNNQGGPGTRPLLYAQEDARKVHAILLRLGGVREADAALLLDAEAPAALEALARLEERSARAAREGARTELLLYYSGHARDGALRLGKTPLPLEVLKGRLARAPADVRIGILDACRSGSVTRRKGARRAPAFEVQADASQVARGLVLLTSSAADEDSQESDLLGGSYFTHHLASGMLGDADSGRDGRVSLSEAYAYAYERTVADTVESAAGAQHPTFHFDLAGNGDVTLTEVTARREGLTLPQEAPAGAYFLVDARGFVAAEVHKPAGEARTVALAPGTYRVKRRLEDRLRVGEVQVAAGRLTVLEEGRLKDTPFSDDPVKGPSRLLSPEPRWSVSLTLGGQGFFDKPTRDSLFPSLGLVGLEAQLRDFFRRDWVWGLDVATGQTRQLLSLEGLPGDFGYTYRQTNVGTSLLAEWPGGPLVPFVGGRLALLLLGRTFDADTGLPAQSMSTLTPGLVAGVRLQPFPALSFSLRGRVHYLLYTVDESRSLGYAELAGMVTYAL